MDWAALHLLICLFAAAWFFVRALSKFGRSEAFGTDALWCAIFILLTAVRLGSA